MLVAEGVVVRKAARGSGRARPAAATHRAPRQPPVAAALAALAHEVRTPLTGILALAELLAAADLPARERGWATALKSAAEHLAGLTSIVIDGVKAGRGGLVLRREPFSPKAVAEAVGASLAARAQTRGLTAEVAVGELPAHAVGDPVRLRAALENLVDNAVKFTERGRVAFSAGIARTGRNRVRLRFTVEDSGIGLTAAEIKKLFRPFSQASAAVARRFGGAGLGLAFVSSSARAMGGKLSVASAPGRGSIFRFEVTVSVPARAGAKARTTEGRRNPRGAPRRILCAEDNPYGRLVLATMLRELGHEADFVASGEAAVEAAARGGYDFVLMDITLAGLDGIAAARRIRALPGAAARVPIVAISGRSDGGEAARARRAGINAFLAKPVGPAALAGLLAGLAPAGRSPQRRRMRPRSST